MKITKPYRGFILGIYLIKSLDAGIFVEENIWNYQNYYQNKLWRKLTFFWIFNYDCTYFIFSVNMCRYQSKLIYNTKINLEYIQLTLTKPIIVIFWAVLAFREYILLTVDNPFLHCSFLVYLVGENRQRKAHRNR